MASKVKHLWILVLSAAICVWLVAAARHALGYFLLADDHALIADAAEQGWSGIFGIGLFGVYRPLGFVVAKLAGHLAPSHTGWSVVVLLVHACNALLTHVVASRAGYSRLAAATASTLFLWSPWGSEAYLWFSGIFDVGATCGVLLATLAMTLRGDTPLRESLVVSTAVLGCLIAAGFKENGYLAPAIATALAASGFRPPAFRRVILVVSVGMACTAGVFAYRSSLLASSGTPYSASEFGGRLLSMAAIPAAASNLRGLLLWPVPAVWGDTSRFMATTFIWPVGATLTASLALLGLARRRRVWLLLVALALALALTAFYPIAVSTITPRRYLYLAGLPLALLIGAAVSATPDIHGDAPSPKLSMLLAGLLLAAALAGMSQAKLWGLATATARCAVRDFGTQILDRGVRRAYVDNMPLAVDAGPFILLEYDFRYVYPSRWPGMDVVFRHAVLTVGPDGRLAIQGQGAPPVDTDRRTPTSLDLCLGPAT